VRKESRFDVANENRDIKVTDKRMFTADGELREEYRFLNEKSTATATPEPAAERSPEPPAPPAPAPPVREEPRRQAPAVLEEPTDFPSSLPGMGPTFFDLVQMLIEPAVLYLGDMPLPDGQSAEDLEMARLHIDMLDVLRQKTAGNLTAQESAFLEDLLHRLRLRYVQKRDAQKRV
jgi:Domain of unknown function (DUF1844)